MLGKGQTSTSFPTFWRSPVRSSSSSSSGSQRHNMPGSTDQEIGLSGQGGGDDIMLKNSVTSGVTEHRIHKYVNRPDGEMDMMVGFFLMNGFCIFFFLLFGLCVIFSCLRKRPSCMRRGQKFSDIEEAPLTTTLTEETAIVKPKFKSIVSQVIKTNKVTTTAVKRDSSLDDIDNVGIDIETVKVHGSAPSYSYNDCSRSSSPQYSSNRKLSVAGGGTSRKQSADNNSRKCSITQENSAMIRHNLLGPLSFDDLYYT